MRVFWKYASRIALSLALVASLTGMGALFRLIGSSVSEYFAYADEMGAEQEALQEQLDAEQEALEENDSIEGSSAAGSESFSVESLDRQSNGANQEGAGASADGTHKSSSLGDKSSKTTRNFKPSAVRTPQKGDCFLSDDNDEGRNIVFKVLDDVKRTVQVGSGSAGKTFVINDADEEAANRKEYATITENFSGTITIPETINYEGITYTVTSIADYAFSSYKSPGEVTFKLRKIVLPSTVTYIGAYAFQKAALSAGIAFADECNIETIETGAFSGTAIRTFSLPDTVTSLGNSVFLNCESLNKFEFPENSSIAAIPASCFRGCSSLKQLNIPRYITCFEPRAFQGCAFQSFTIPKQIDTLGSYVFTSCGALSSFNFEEGTPLTEIPAYAFSNCTSLQSFTIPSFIVSINEYAFSGSGLRTITVPKTCTYLGDSCFRTCQQLKKVEFEEGHQLLKISSYLFMDCSALSEIELPSNVRSIEKNAFQECGDLKTINIPAKVTSLGGFAFAQDTSLETVIYQGNANKITSETSTFYKCRNIKSVVFMKKKSKAITYTNANPTFYYTISFYKSYEDAQSDTDVMEYFAIPANSVPQDTNSSDAFVGKMIDPPENYRWVCQDGCSFSDEITDSFYAYGEFMVKDLKVGDTFTARTPEGILVTYTVTSLAKDGSLGTCRVGADALTATRMPAMNQNSAGILTLTNQVSAPDANSYVVEEISSYAFVNCGKFVELIVPASVKKIDSYAFYRCSMLRNITFEADASSIVDDGIFAACGNIKTVIFGGKKAKLSFGTSAPDIYYSVVCYDSKHDKEINNKAVTLVVHERAKLGNLQDGELKSGKIPDLSLGYKWHYEDGFGADIALTDSCFMYMEGIGFQSEISVRLGNVNKTPCWFKILDFDEANKTGSVQVGLGVDGVNAIAGYVSGMPIIPSTITDDDGNTYNVVAVGDYAFGASKIEEANPYITSLIMPASVTKLGEGAFRNCESLETISIPSGATEVGASAFESCVSLKSVSVAGVTKLTTISKHSFFGCERLSSFTLPASVKVIKEGAFASCIKVNKKSDGSTSYSDGLTGFSIPKNSVLETIEADAFVDVQNLTGTIEFPATLKTIGAKNFKETALRVVQFAGTSTEFGDDTFYQCMSLQTIRFLNDARSLKFGSDTFHLWKYTPRGDVQSGALKRVEFYGKKYDQITNVIDMDKMADNNYGRQYNLYYNVSFYGSNSDFKNGKVHSSELVIEDTKMTDKTPKLGDYITWRCEDGFSLSARTQNSYYAIAGKDISYATPSGIKDSYHYTGGYIKPMPTLTMPDGTVLKLGVDYELDTNYGLFNDGYSNNRRMGTATIYLRGIGDYAGTNKVKFKIVGTYDSSAVFAVSLDNYSYTYDGTQKCPHVTVTITTKGKSYTGEEGVDYKVSYLDNVNAGTAQTVVEGLGIYSSVKSIDFTINPMSISRCNVTKLKASYDALRLQIILEVALQNPRGVTLIEGQDYELINHMNTGIGAGTLMVRGVGNYTGVLSRSFGVGGTGGNGNGSGGSDGDGNSAVAGFADSDYDGTGYNDAAATGQGNQVVNKATGEVGTNNASQAGETGSKSGGSKWRLFAVGNVDQVVDYTAATPYMLLLIALLVLLGLGYVYHRTRFEHQLRPVHLIADDPSGSRGDDAVRRGVGSRVIKTDNVRSAGHAVNGQGAEGRDVEGRGARAGARGIKDNK